MLRLVSDVLRVLSLVLLVSGCGGDGSDDADSSAGDVAMLDDGSTGASSTGATETNFVPVACTSDEECPVGVACVRADPGDEFGFCDVGEANALPPAGSGDAAADEALTPCTNDAECSDGVTCVFPSGEDQPGFCDENQILEPGDEGATPPGTMQL